MASCLQCGANVEGLARFCGNCGATVVDSDDATLPDPDQAGPAPHTSDPMLGRKIKDQYVIQTKLGQGGMGAVYVADQPSIGRTVAIKVLHPWFSADPTVAARFETEARAAARLSNPHIVSIFNYGDIGDGTLYIAMEHLDGRSLADLLVSESRLTPERAVAIASQCCAALAEAHANGIVHRDLKPSNVMLVRSGTDQDFVKVVDFGVAKLEGGGVTTTGATVGTPKYMSPEQLRGSTLDGRSDLYSLGIMLYEMVCGRVPFEADSAIAYVHKHMSETPPAMRTVAPGIVVHPPLEAVIQRMLAKDPALRPADANACSAELRAALSASAAAVPVARVASVPASSSAPSAGVLAAAIAGFVLLAGGLTTLVVLSDDGDTDDDDDTIAEVETAESKDETKTEGDALGQETTQATETKTGDDDKAPEDADDGKPIAAEDLTKLSIEELREELEKTASVMMGPGYVNMLLSNIDQAMSAYPDTPDYQYMRKMYYVQLILSFRQSQAQMQQAQTPPQQNQAIPDQDQAAQMAQMFGGMGGDQSVEELEKIFYSMETKMPLTEIQRREALESVMSASSVAGEDAETMRRMYLYYLINMYASDPSVLEPKGDGDGGLFGF